MLTVSLKDLNLDVVTAVSGKNAVACLEKATFALILMDVQMAELNGFQTAKIIRERETLRHTPIIFVTAARQEPADFFEGYDKGAVDYLLKPLDIRILRSKVRVFVKLFDQQAQLEQLRKMEAVGQLTAGIAHDFNNMLQVINGYAQLLKESLGDQTPHREKIDWILQAGNRGKELVQSLLAFSRQQVVRPETLDFNKLIREVHKQVLCTFMENVQVKLKLQEDVSPIFVDSGQMHQLLINLCSNARDAMPDGGTLLLETKAIEVKGENLADHPVDTAGDYIQLRVIDTGCGISPEALKRIFEPFFTTKDVGKGTGLGLSTVHGIVKQNGGSLNVKSHLGVGTTFTICFPVKKKHDS